MPTDNPPARSPGRPKDVTLDAAILAAAERHLGERGYAGMTIQGVAAAAGTTAPSLRRRYRDKLELAMASIDAMQTQPLPAKAKDPRAETRAILRNMHATMISGNGLAILTTIIAEQARHPELLAHFRQRVVEPSRERLRRALSAGVETGQLPAGLGVDTMVSMLTGALYARYLNGQQLPEDWAEHVLHIIWPASPMQPSHLRPAWHSQRAGTGRCANRSRLTSLRALEVRSSDIEASHRKGTVDNSMMVKRAG
jgi:AcrR family transcriptional regulator